MNPTLLLAGILAFGLAACAAFDRTPQASELEMEVLAAPTRLSILQGVTDKTTTQLTVVRKAMPAVKYSLRDALTGKEIENAELRQESRSGSEWVVDQVRYKGLQSNSRYFFEVKSQAEIVDARELQTLETDLPEVTFAVVSCMDDKYVTEQKSMWTELLQKKPNLIFMLGDNVYGDSKIAVGPADGKTLWNRYVETRNNLEFYRTRRLVPVFATWDDHDFGINDGDRTNPNKKDAEKVFRAFFPQPVMANTLESGPGVSSHLTAFGQHFFLMDDRSFRSPPKDPNQTHWGTEQEHWLYERLGDTKAPVWLMNGDQFFGGYHKFESYEGVHPKSFKALLAQLKKFHAPVVFVSGDRHLAEIQAIEKKLIGYATYELTSSAIHAKTYPDSWKRNPNRRKIGGESGVMNYLIVKSSTPKFLLFEATAYGPGNRVLYHFQKEVRHK